MDIKLHIDLHNHPNVTGFGRNFDPAAFARTAASTGARSVNVFIKCNGGWCYYPTDIGTPYPYMTCDMLGDTVRECHARGITVIGYICVALDYETGAKHPELLRVNENGERITEPKEDPFCMTLCTEGEYGDRLVEITREAATRYGLDGIFADNLLALPCYCPRCLEKAKNRGVDIENKTKMQRFALDNALAFARRLKEAAGDIPLEIKGLPYKAAKDISDCAYIPQENYDTYPAYSAYLRTMYEKCYLLAGRFLRGWGDFGGRREAESVLCDMQETLLCGTGFCLGDHMDSVRGLDTKMYAEYEGTFKALSALQKRIGDAKPAAEIAIVINAEKGITDDIKGAVRMLSELKYQFDVIDEDGDFDKYKALVLPDSLTQSEELASRLCSYEGGVLACGCSLLLGGKVYDDGFFCEYDGEWNDENIYFECESHPASCYGKALKLRSDYTRSRLVPPMNALGWNIDRPYIYAPPAPEASGYAACTLTKKRAAISFDVFGAYLKYNSPDHRKLVSELLEKLMPSKLITCDLPTHSRITLYNGDTEDILLVKTNASAGTMLTLEGEYASATVYCGGELPLEVKRGRTVLTLPPVIGFTALNIKHRYGLNR